MSLLFWKTNRGGYKWKKKNSAVDRPSMWSWDRRMRERGENQREKKWGGERCLEKLDSWRSVYLFKWGLSSESKTKWGDYGRSEETLCHLTRCPPLFPPSPSLLCQHEHPVHTHGSSRNCGPLCYKDTLMQEQPRVWFLKEHLHSRSSGS